MKKKFFAVVLAMTMVAGSTFNSFAGDSISDAYVVTEEKVFYTLNEAYILDGDIQTSESIDNPLKGVKTEKITIEYSLTSSEELAAWKGIVQFYNEEAGVAHLGFWPQIQLNDWSGHFCELGTGTDKIFADTLADGKEHVYKYVITPISMEIYVDGEKNLAILSGNEDCQDTVKDVASASGFLFDFITTAEKFSLGYAWKTQNWWSELTGTINNLKLTATVEKVGEVMTTKPSVEPTTPANPSEDSSNPSVEPTTPANPSEDPSNPSVEPTTPANPSEDSSNPSVEQPTTSDSSDFDVTNADAEKVNKEAVVTGLPENVTLRVASIEKSSTDYNAIAEFVNKELKGKKVAAADLSLVKDNVTYAEQPSGKVKVTLSVFENIKDAKWIQVYRYDNTAKKFVEVDKAVEVKDGKFTFETDHFTPYLFASADAPKEEPTPTTTAQSTTTGKTVTDTGSKPKTGDSAPIAVFAGLAAAGLAVFAVNKKRKNA